MKNNFPNKEHSLADLTAMLGGKVTGMLADTSTLPDKPAPVNLTSPTNARFTLNFNN